MKGWNLSYNVIWGESISVRDQYQSFMTYHLSICGVDLFEGTSSFLLTHVRSRHPINMVPEFIFDMVYIIVFFIGRLNANTPVDRSLDACVL